MKKMTVRPATEADAISIAPRLRGADKREIKAAGKEPLSSLLDGVRMSVNPLVAVDSENVPHIIFGVTPSPYEHLGFVWMMATPKIKDCWVQLLRETPRWIEQMSSGFGVLGNFVHEKNTVHIKWLKWAGFVFLRKIEMNGHGFYEFARLTKTSGE